MEFISKWCGEKEKQDKEVNRMSDGDKCQAEKLRKEDRMSHFRAGF